MRFRAKTPQLPLKPKPIARAVAEVLEARTLLSLSPVGGEVHVNTYTPNFQSNPAVASDADGDTVIVWQSNGQEGNPNVGLFAQRFNSAGLAQGGEIHINVSTAGGQVTPAVAMDADGDFTIAWVDDTQEGAANVSSGVFARRFDAAGNPLTGEIHVNSVTDGNQINPTIASDPAGNFVVAYESRNPSAPSGPVDVYARRFDSSGTPQGTEFKVNTTTESFDHGPAIAMDYSGDFVITWQSYLQDGEGYGIYDRRYNSAGVAQSGEVRVNAVITGHQMYPSIAMDPAGDYVISWDEFDIAGTTYSIYAQRYNAAGTAVGSTLVANTVTTGRRFSSSTAMSASGGFVISWQSLNQDGSGWGIYGRQFDSSGSPIGSEFRVNTTTLNNQINAVIAADPSGNYTIAWQSPDQPAGDDGIFAQRYHEPSTDTLAPIVAGVFLNGKAVLPYSSQPGSIQQLLVSFSENLTDAGGSSGANSIVNPANWLLVRNGADVTNLITSITYGFNPVTNRYEATLSFPNSVTFSTGNYFLKLKDNVRDIAGNRLDGDSNLTAGGNFNTYFSLSPFGARGSEFRANTFTASTQSRAGVAMDAQGNYVLVWDSYTQETGALAGYGIYGQRYNSAGVPVGGEFHVNTTVTNNQLSPSVAMDSDGDFVVTWLSGNGAYTIFAQRFNSAGVPQGSEFQVSTTGAGKQAASDIAMDPAGNFVVVFSADTADDATHVSSNIFARCFNSGGVAQGPEIAVNTTLTGSQHLPHVAVSVTGDFIIDWAGPDGSTDGIFAQRFDSAGNKVGLEFRANTTTAGVQLYSDVAIDPAGNFVITWNSSSQDGSLNGIYAQRFSAAGTPQGGEFLVNTTTFGDQNQPVVGTGSNGFLISWNSNAQDGSQEGVYAQRYSSSGAAVGSEFLVNDTTSGNEAVPTIAMNEAGNAVIGWTETSSSGLGLSDVYAKRYSLDATPTVGALTNNPDPVASGNSLTLSASNVTDDGSVSSVSFYRESNNEPGLQFGPGGDALVGSTSTNNGGFWLINISTTGLSAGTYTYYAQATDDAALTGAPAFTSSTVTGAVSAPNITAASFIYQTAPQRLSFTFNRDVQSSLSSNSVLVQRLVPNPANIPTSNPVWDGTSNTVIFNFTGILPDGDYRATLDVAGAHYVLNFFFMQGDLNHDRTVTISDFIDLSAHFNQSPATWPQGDLNYDGSVTISDFIDLASKFNASLGPPPPAAAAASATEIQNLAKTRPHHRRQAPHKATLRRSPVRLSFSDSRSSHGFFR
jgi:hypothetical protein